MEALDESGDLIAWIDDDWQDWCSTCKSCNALGTNKCEFPEIATPDTKFHEIGCRYEDKCASWTKLGTEIKINKYDKEKEVGDISVLAAIKEQLELGIEDCINIKVTVFVGDIAGKINTFISKEKWEER